MSHDKTHHAESRRYGVGHEEEKAWIGFYRNAGQPAIAAEVIRLLDAEPEMKRARLGLYLRCKESLRAHKARQARSMRIGC